MHGLALGCLALAACLAWGSARAETRVEVVETHPAGDRVTVGPGEPVWLRMSFSTGEPVRIWARPWHRGQEVPTATHGSAVYEGGGDAIGWFWLEPGQQVDEVRILVGGAGQPDTRLVATHPVHILGAGAAQLRPPDPPWIARLQADAEERRASWLARHPTPGAGLLTGVLATILVGGLLIAGTLGIVAPIVAFQRWSGRWRVAAAVPLAIIALAVLNIAVGIAINRSSHNLFPMEIMLAGLVSAGIMLVLWLARRFLRARG